MSIANNLIKDLPKGPLDAYRKRATFDWKSFKLTLESEDGVRFQVLELINFNTCIISIQLYNLYYIYHKQLNI